MNWSETTSTSVLRLQFLVEMDSAHFHVANYTLKGENNRHVVTRVVKKGRYEYWVEQVGYSRLKSMTSAQVMFASNDASGESNMVVGGINSISEDGTFDIYFLQHMCEGSPPEVEKVAFSVFVSKYIIIDLSSGGKLINDISRIANSRGAELSIQLNVSK
tara:strand:+ start:18 stop:497 length:480 start_codon:yes stop_codon:yes gene_type:complete